MRLRDLVQVALLMAVGYVLRVLTPPVVLGMKPDIMLIMLFSVILLKRNLTLSLEAGVIAGIVTALTTTFPGGQLANLVDKFFTSLFALALTRLLIPPLPDKVAAPVVAGLGTLFSGGAFLTVALLTVGLPTRFAVLYGSVVVPAAVFNTLAVTLLYPLLKASERAVSAGAETGRIKGGTPA